MSKQQNKNFLTAQLPAPSFYISHFRCCGKIPTGSPLKRGFKRGSFFWTSILPNLSNEALLVPDVLIVTKIVQKLRPPRMLCLAFVRLPLPQLSVWPHLFRGAGHKKLRGEQLEWSLAFRLYIGSFPMHSYQDQFIQAGLAKCFTCI